MHLYYLHDAKWRWRIVISLLLIVATMYVFGFSYRDWGMMDDDYGDVFRSFTSSSWADVRAFFNGSNAVNYGINPSHAIERHPLPFFEALYRPVWQVFCMIQVKLLGISPYGYLLVSAAFHALNCVLLFNIFYSYGSLALSLITTLLFAFHPVISEWFGVVSRQLYVVNATLILLTLILYQSFIKRSNISAYIGSLVLFSVSILMRETVFFLPGWMTCVTWLYYTMHDDQQSVVDSFYESLMVTLPYYLISLMYLGVRFILFPVGESAAIKAIPSLGSVIWYLKTRFYDFVTILVDTLGVNIVPSGYSSIKFLFLLAFLAVIGVIFFYTKKKVLMALMAAGFLLMAWPSFVLGHQPRYLYEAYPWLVGMIFVGVLFFKRHRNMRRFARMGTTLASCIIGIGIVHSVSVMQSRECLTYRTSLALERLVADFRTQDRALCFVGVPNTLFPPSGIAQAVRMYSGDHGRKVFHDGVLSTYDHTKFNRMARVPCKNLIDVVRIKDGVRLVSRDASCMWFQMENAFGKSLECCVGTSQACHRSQAHIDEVAVTFDQEIKSARPLLITWDYEAQDFRILDDAEGV